MQYIEKIFTLTAVTGVSLISYDYYMKHYYVKCPQNHAIYVKDYFNNKFQVKESDFYPIPYYHTTRLYKTKHKLEIQSRSSTRDLEVVNIKMLVDLDCPDVIKTQALLGTEIENDSIELLGDQLNSLCRRIRAKGHRTDQIKQSLGRQLETSVRQTFSDLGINLNIQIASLRMDEKIPLRMYPESLM